MNTWMHARSWCPAGLAVLVAGVALACSSRPGQPAGDAAAPAAVNVATIAATDLTESFETGGVVQAKTTAVVSARILAPVRAVRVAPGDRVRAGQVLLILDDRDLEAHARSARAAVAGAGQGATAAAAEERAAQAALALARATHDRIERLHSRRSATPQELDDATASLQAAEARAAGAAARVQSAVSAVEGARGASDAAAATEALTRISAPFDGVITEKMVEPGNMASPGLPLLRIEDTHGFRLDVRVDESQVRHVTTGATVPVLLDTGTTAGAVTFNGTVAEVGRAVDSDARSFIVKIALPTTDGLRSGMFGRARFAGAARRALTVPADALVRRGQVTTVFVVDKGVARLRLVNVAGREVLAGLTEGETVVVAPASDLVDGRAVRERTAVTRTFGAAGRLAAAFVDSKLTPLFIVASLALGALAVLALPREEEPQIVVPMVDVLVQMPGATPSDVEQRVTRPMERLLWEVPGVEYIYSTSSAGQALVIVRFRVGEPEEDALVRLNQKLASHADIVPPGAIGPLVKPRSIDDVPIVAITLWSPRYDDFQLRTLAAQLRDAIAEVADVSEVTLIGGRPRQLGVTLNPARLAAYRLDPLVVQQAIVRANTRTTTGGLVGAGQITGIEAGGRLASRDEVADIVVASPAGRPVRLRDVADVVDGDAEPTSYVVFQTRASGADPAVTIAVAKRRGTNATDVSHRVSRKLDTLKGTLIPGDVQVTLTRDYGETAAEKSNELLWHMLLAVLSVSALIWFALGRREAAVVLVAVPVTLALTLFMFYLYGYTLNRITLFALIFSIGILVDDAIVVVENVVRHARLRTGEARGLVAVALEAVDEVGNPTILATLAVVAAILPMAFVGGLMGPYMRPIPVGASAAMMFSLVVAFIVTPWAAVRLLKPAAHHGADTEDLFTRLYRRIMNPLIASGRLRLVFLSGVALLLAAAAALVPLGLVTVKMLPFDNKGELQVIVDMPDGTALEETARVTSALATEVLEDPAVRNVQQYVGTSAPYSFNGLVRHYFLRRAPHLADVQVNLVGKGDRSAKSHEVARRVRDRLLPIARASGATIQIAEVPPGPPVLQTLVAEVYGPDGARRNAVAAQIKEIFNQTPGVVDTDWYVEERRSKVSLVVDDQKATAAGLSAAAVASVVRMAGDGEIAGLMHVEEAREDVPIVLRLPREGRSLEAVRTLRLGTVRPVAVGELTQTIRGIESPSVYHKNLQPVTYVTGDLAGRQESPVYAIGRMNEAIGSLTLPEGYALEVFNATQPFDTSKYAMKWDGEWQITIEVFRDLGLAFAAVLLLIYVLVVGWFQSFRTPLLIMAAIPFSLVGILPAHAAMGAFFTATSMIGFIAGAGIVVRNSIILVDFIELRLREGFPLERAVVDAGAVRFRPMALTAAAVVVGAGVILFDPIFEGLAISLMAGEVASLSLSRMAVPVLYYIARRRESPLAGVAVATSA